MLEADNADEAARLIENGRQTSICCSRTWSCPASSTASSSGCWAREHRPRLKVLLTSGFPQGMTENEVPGVDPLPFLMKPYSKQTLQEAVEALLRT